MKPPASENIFASKYMFFWRKTLSCGSQRVGFSLFTLSLYSTEGDFRKSFFVQKWGGFAKGFRFFCMYLCTFRAKNWHKLVWIAGSYIDLRKFDVEPAFLSCVTTFIYHTTSLQKRRNSQVRQRARVVVGGGMTSCSTMCWTRSIVWRAFLRKDGVIAMLSARLNGME